ncbi:MAG: hypothetical protein RIT81_36125 [Deltaproteobacteria bacterium]
MNDERLRAAVSTIPRLRACAVVSTRGGALRATYLSPTESWDAIDFAQVVGRLFDDASGALGLIGGGGAEQLLLEARGRRVALQALDANHVAAFVFDREAKLGMIRHRLDDLRAGLAQSLGDGNAQRGATILEYLERNAADTHAALLRVSLQTGLPMSLLRTPDSLSEAELESVAASVRQILGVQTLGIES